MTTITIDLPDEQAAALKARATEEGLTVESLVSRRLAETERLLRAKRQRP